MGLDDGDDDDNDDLDDRKLVGPGLPFIASTPHWTQPLYSEDHPHHHRQPGFIDDRHCHQHLYSIMMIHVLNIKDTNIDQKQPGFGALGSFSPINSANFKVLPMRPSLHRREKVKVIPWTCLLPKHTNTQGNPKHSVRMWQRRQNLPKEHDPAGLTHPHIGLSVQKVEVGNIWFTFFAIPSDSLVCARGRSTIGCSSLQRCTVLLKRRGVNSESSCAGERGQSLESDPKNSNSTFNHGKRFSNWCK